MRATHARRTARRKGPSEGSHPKGQITTRKIQALQDPRILVVDDDPCVRDMIASFLRLEGFQVQTAADGAEALDSVAQERPTLVLLDMDMPVVDGWTFVRELNRRGIELPVVAMTAAQNARQWAKEIGAAAYVAKPINLPMLLARIDQIAA